MPRIRSLHPGLFTDENYAVLSFPARELLKGLWVEADDNGVFEWKPLSLKMRIFPADNVDVPALLDELSANWVQMFEEGGRRYGACKNFCKYQRPKKPKGVHPLPEEMKPFVRHGYKHRSSEHEDAEPVENDNDVVTGSETVPHQFPTGTEKSGQMEDVGGRRKKEISSDFEAFYQTYPRHEAKGQAEKAYRTALKATDAATLLQAAQRFRRDRQGQDPKFTPLPGSWLNGKRWLDEPEQSPTAAAVKFEPTDLFGWRCRVRVWVEENLWHPKNGPKPGEPGCMVPAEILQEFNLLDEVAV